MAIARLPPLLRLPPEIRELILRPFLTTDDTLLCSSRVFGNRVLGWKTYHGVQPELMFTCRLLYLEVLHMFVRSNVFSFSVPPTTTTFFCVRHAPYTKSIRIQMLCRHWPLWQTYLRENTPLTVKALHLQILPPMSIGSRGSHDHLVDLLNLCACVMDSIIVTESVKVVMAFEKRQSIRSQQLQSVL